ncbi:MAG: glycoside hydrolase family 32 protein [Devosia sp.]|uniref:glycoside hydrolase family 32 protein n=1 Tax=Devosia sp. TaxID=1871048 RepID=UPI0024CC4EC8|nr:glycoside hydrolase family 32 protein [Devosia sp.]UYN98955.1 MAG: glycoside hydrolase family 32 protein [Devosia sp.]
MSEKFRPQVHFSPRRGWMNDPNGMVRVDGIWHLFFQHDPDSTRHGPMHWGHATSTDLVHWSEAPTALYPDKLGTCFSGSALETDAGGIELFYTAHSRTEAGEDHQVQCLVHADRGLDVFTPDPTNPVLPNPGYTAFRDPKVIWHAPTRRWIMLVTEGQRVGFYGSDDRRTWRHLSSFGEQHGRHSPGPWECPDLVPLQAPGGETFWVLIVGLNPGGYAPGSGTQYFVGQFDGTTFRNANPPATELWLDYGRDYYAAQTFFERGGTWAPTAIAWASNWLYAHQTDTEAFRGVMSLPRQLRLVETDAGLRVAASVPSGVLEAAFSTPQDGVWHRNMAVDLRPGEALQLTLFGEERPHFVIARHSAGRASIRTIRASRPGMDGFEHDYAIDIGWPATGALDVSLHVDRGLVELSAGHGLVWITNLFFPTHPEADMELTVREGADA